MSDAERIVRQLFEAANEQLDALGHAVAHNAPGQHGLSACLQSSLAYLDKAAVLLVVQLGSEQPPSWIVSELETLHRRSASLSAPPGAQIDVRRFAKRLSANGGELSRFRRGAILDLSGRLLSGLSQEDVDRYCDATTRAAREVVCGVVLRGVDLRMARMSSTRMFGLNASESILDGAFAGEAWLSSVNLAGASLRNINLQAAIARDCDFTGADLTNARWHGGTVVRCSFAGATLADVSADGALFLDCDFRGADLSASTLAERATLARTQLRRCDLRWSRWTGRTVSGVELVDCKLHGLLAPESVGSVIVDGPDLSLAGDGRIRSTPAEALALWSAGGRA